MKNISNIGITINFDKNLYSNGLQQNVVILNDLLNQFDELDFPAKPRWQLDEKAIFLKGAGVKI